jgi:hypothetical protein
MLCSFAKKLAAVWAAKRSPGDGQQNPRNREGAEKEKVKYRPL